MEIPPYEESKDVVQRKLDQTTMILQNINAYFLLIDKDFIVCDTNYYSLNKLPAPEVGMTQKVGDLLHCRNAAEAGECGMHQQCKLCGIRAAIGRAFHKKESFQKVNASMNLLNDKEDKVIPCDVSVSGAYVVINGEDHMVLTVYDVTELQNVQRLLNIERKNSISAERLKSTFIANISHEVRTPLNAIVGFSQVLIDEEDQEARRQFADIIQSNNDLLQRLISDVLDISKIESNTISLHYAEYDLPVLMSEIYNIILLRMNEGVELQLADCPPCMLYIDRNRLTQVLTNLLTNAIKHTKAGFIRFGYEAAESEVCFFVQDTGEGIPEEQQEQIFSRFVQLDDWNKGVGLGLAICKGLLEKMNGSIRVTSKVGEGSVFYVKLPRI